MIGGNSEQRLLVPTPVNSWLTVLEPRISVLGFSVQQLSDGAGAAFIIFDSATGHIPDRQGRLVLDFLGDLRRTHTCGALRASDAGKKAILMGWVNRRRDL